MLSIESYPQSTKVPSTYDAFTKKWDAIELGYDSPITELPLNEKRIDIVNVLLSSAHPAEHGRKAYLLSHCQLSRNKIDDLIFGKASNYIEDIDLIKLMTLPLFNPLIVRRLLLVYNRNPYIEPFSSIIAYFSSRLENHSYVFYAPTLKELFPSIFMNEL